MDRRLAAILAADVVGYTGLMQRDEAGTHARLSDLQREILVPVIARHRGEIFKTTGDGVLAHFPSVVDAVTCAVEWQRAAAEHEAQVPDDKRLRFRIGINLGDVIFADGDLYGDGVNIATRLEKLAEPGGVCVSDEAVRHASGKVDVDFEELGPRRLKNVAEPVRVFRIAPAAAAPAGGSGRSRPVVAVLPFENMSGDAEQEYFSDGLAEDIITALSHWRSLPVIARNSSFSYKGRHVRVQQIADELGARYVLEGSVRKAGTRVRITAQLIDATSGHHVWADRFDRQMEDIFELQDEITHRVVSAIVPELEQFEHRRSRSKPTEDLDAWDLYLRGMFRFFEETCESTQEAIGMFRKAVERDPGYGDAWARMGWALCRLIMLGCVQNREETLRIAEEAARRALASDPGSALAHMAMGSFYIWSEKTELGLAEAQRALELNPNLAHAAMAVGNRLDLVGRTEEGIEQMERALALNPRDPMRWRYFAYLSRAYIGAERYERAAECAREAVLLRSDHPEALFRCAICTAHLDELTETRELLGRCLAIDPTYLERKAAWRPYSDDARNAHLLSGLRRHGLLPQP